MYAIVDIAGQQFKVQKEQKLYVHRLDSAVGSQVDFNKVLLIDNEKSVVVGEPIIEGAMITAKVIEHVKGDKVIVFKKKRRKGYKVKNGHRQFFTMIEVEDIIEKGAKPKSAKQTATPKAVTEEPVADKVVAKAEVTDETKVASETETKKAAAKKPAAKEESEATKEAKKPAKATAKAEPAKKEAPKKPTTAAKKASPAAKKTAAAKKDKDSE